MTLIKARSRGINLADTFAFTGTVSGAGGGITVADMWRITSGVTGTNSPLTSNWERVDTNGMGTIGSAMTQSSGIFTFPTTGVYRIKFQCMFSRSGAASDYNGARIYQTQDNSSYNLSSTGYVWFENTTAIYGMTSAETIFDVTDTSTHKVKFNVNRESSVELHGSSSSSITFVVFDRLGDT